MMNKSYDETNLYYTKSLLDHLCFSGFSAIDTNMIHRDSRGCATASLLTPFALGLSSCNVWALFEAGRGHPQDWLEDDEVKPLQSSSSQCKVRSQIPAPRPPRPLFRFLPPLLTWTMRFNDRPSQQLVVDTPRVYWIWSALQQEKKIVCQWKSYPARLSKGDVIKAFHSSSTHTRYTASSAFIERQQQPSLRQGQGRPLAAVLDGRCPLRLGSRLLAPTAYISQIH